MAKQWKCARCSTKNDEGTLTCSNCRMIRGAVVVPGSSGAWDARPAEPPADPWPADQSTADRSAPPSTQDWSSTPGPTSTWPGADQPPTDEPGQTSPSFWTPADGLAAQPAAAPLGRKVPIGWVIFVILLGVGAVASFLTSASRSDTGEIVSVGDMMATDLRVGDCFDLKDPSAEEITDVTARPCTEPHEFELFWTGNMAEGDYPSEVEFDAFFDANCIDAFTNYVGKTYADSVLDIYWLYPLEEGWDLGDRSIQCATYNPANNQLIVSTRGSGV